MMLHTCARCGGDLPESEAGWCRGCRLNPFPEDEVIRSRLGYRIWVRLPGIVRWLRGKALVPHAIALAEAKQAAKGE